MNRKRWAMFFIITGLLMLAATYVWALGGDSLIKDIRAYAAAQGVTANWIDSKTDAEIYTALDSHFNFTQAQTDKLKKRDVRFALREILIRDASKRSRISREKEIYWRLKSFYPDIRAQRRQINNEEYYYIVRTDGGDPNDIP